MLSLEDGVWAATELGATTNWAPASERVVPVRSLDVVGEFGLVRRAAANKGKGTEFVFSLATTTCCFLSRLRAAAVAGL
jgi:hypothetical protein